MTSNGGLRYFAEFKNNRPENKMDHLACFSGEIYHLLTYLCVNVYEKMFIAIQISSHEFCQDIFSAIAGDNCGVGRGEQQILYYH